MARKDETRPTPGQQASTPRTGSGRDDDWYRRWIDSLAADMAEGMQGEQEREERMTALELRLAQLRRSLKQVRGGQRGRAPRSRAGATPSAGEDARILAEVQQRLAEDWYVDASEIEIEVTDGEVVLTGAVENRAAKRLAEDCVDSVPGVRDVHNRLRIRH